MTKDELYKLDRNKKIELIEKNKYLDVFIDDESWTIRCAVARQDYKLGVLINDKDDDVRATVAKQGYGLDKLINDESWKVRCAVARQGYGLDKLINDGDEYVRCAAKEMLEKNRNNNIKPNHYKLKVNDVDIEVRDIMKALSIEEYHAFCKMNAIKYVLRADKKNGQEDLRKAIFYLNELVE